MAEAERLLDLPPLQPWPSLSSASSPATAAAAATASTIAAHPSSFTSSSSPSSSSPSSTSSSAPAVVSSTARLRLAHVPDSRYQWTDSDDQALMQLVALSLAVMKTSARALLAVDDELDALWSALLDGSASPADGSASLYEDPFANTEPVLHMGGLAQAEAAKPLRGAFSVPTAVSTAASAWMRTLLSSLSGSGSSSSLPPAAAAVVTPTSTAVAQLNWTYIADMLNAQARASRSMGRDRSATECFDRYCWLQQLRQDDRATAKKAKVCMLGHFFFLCF